MGSFGSWAKRLLPRPRARANSPGDLRSLASREPVREPWNGLAHRIHSAERQRGVCSVRSRSWLADPLGNHRLANHQLNLQGGPLPALPEAIETRSLPLFWNFLPPNASSRSALPKSPKPPPCP